MAVISLSLSFNAYATQLNSRFPGFVEDDVGYGFFLGEPISFKYQKWSNWRNAHAYGVGYEQNGKMLTGSWTYYFYQLSEDDRWKGDAYIGTIMYGFHVGATGSVHVGDEDEAARVGVEGGINFEYLVPDSPISIRLEITPVLYAAGKETAGLHGGVGLTYYFDKEGRPQAFNRGYIEKAEDREFEKAFEEDSLGAKPQVQKKRIKRRKKVKKKKSRTRKKKIKKDDDGELEI